MNGGPFGRERGAALAVVVLLMLGMLALAHGMLLASLRELAASRAAVRQLESRAAAEASVRRGLDADAGAWMDSVALWGTRTTWAGELGRSHGQATVRRLGAEAWLVEGSGAVEQNGLTRAAVLAWSLDPLRRVSALEGVVSVGPGVPVLGAGPIDATAPTSMEPPLTPADCVRWADRLETLYQSEPLSPVAVLPADSTGLALGLLAFDSLLAQVEVGLAGAGTPGPAEALGTCLVGEGWNWGDPDRPWRPCGSHFALRAAEGDLFVEGGVGQGLILVGGDLTLAAGSRFYGLVIARGVLRLTEAARLDGMALATGGVDISASSRVKGTPCWALRALSAHRDRLGAFRLLSSGEWIGPR